MRRNQTARLPEALLSRIREEILATKTCSHEGFVKWEYRLEPNPEMHCSDGTLYETTRDRQHIYVPYPVYGTVTEEVLDEKRVLEAAKMLTDLVISDERAIGVAKKLMGDDPLFSTCWEEILQKARKRKTRRIAAGKLGHGPADILWKAAARAGQAMRGPAEIVGRVVCAVVLCGAIHHHIWPESGVAKWIDTAVSVEWKSLAERLH